MTGWMILLIVLAILWLISRVRLGGAVGFSEGVLSVDVKVGPLRLAILPRKEKEARKKKPPKEKKVSRYLSVAYSFPHWLVKHFISLYGEEDTEKQR